MIVQRAIVPAFAGLCTDSQHGAGILAIDFEASCLPRHGRSYPIEVGIADGQGTARSWLIRPSSQWEGWTWTEEAERLHGLTRERLFDEGQSATVVTVELRQAVAGHCLVADSEIDGYWMRTLAAAGGVSPLPAIEHIMTLVGQLDLPDEEVRACVDLVDRRGFPRHRAADDARWLAALIASLIRTSEDRAVRRGGLLNNDPHSSDAYGVDWRPRSPDPP